MFDFVEQSLEFRCLRFPLSDNELKTAEAARDLHKTELRSEREFPTLPLRENWFLGVASLGDEVIGYISAEILEVYESEWYLNWIVVSSNHRGLGIGTKLLGVVATQADVAGAPLLILSPLADEHDRLSDFYSARGFRWVERPNTSPSEFFEATPQEVIHRCGRVACN